MGIRQIQLSWDGVGSLSCKHEEGEDYDVDLAGSENVADRVAGDGTPIIENVKTAKSVTLPKIINNRTQKTLEFISKCVASGVRGRVTVTTNEGESISILEAIIVDKITASGKTGTISIKVQGGESSGYIS